MSLVPIEHSQGVKTRAGADDDRRNPTRARHISPVMVPARSHASICQTHFLRYIHTLTSSLFSESEESKQRKWATHGKSVLGVAREMPNAMPFGLASSRSLALSLTSNPCPFFCKKKGTAANGTHRRHENRRTMTSGWARTRKSFRPVSLDLTRSARYLQPPSGYSPFVRHPRGQESEVLRFAPHRTRLIFRVRNLVRVMHLHV